MTNSRIHIVHLGILVLAYLIFNIAALASSALTGTLTSRFLTNSPLTHEQTRITHEARVTTSNPFVHTVLYQPDPESSGASNGKMIGLPSQSPEDDSRTNMSVGAIVGVVVGVFCVLCLILCWAYD